MENKIIYDIGMHNGDDTKYYLSQGYNVVSIEASPELVEKAKVRFSDEIEAGKLVVLNIGIADRDGEMNFYLNKKNSVWNSFDPKIAKRQSGEFETIVVKTQTVNSVMEEFGIPYYMKIDIEGNDIICLRSLNHMKSKPKYVSAEVNFRAVITQMKDLGYNRFKLIDQFSLLPLEVPITKAYRNFRINKSFIYSTNLMVRILRKLFRKPISKMLLGQRAKLLKYNFPFGSSGTFGEKLPGKWYSYEEVMNVYDNYYQMHKSSGKDVGFNFWVDIHGTY